MRLVMHTAYTVIRKQNVSTVKYNANLPPSACFFFLLLFPIFTVNSDNPKWPNHSFLCRNSLSHHFFPELFSYVYIESPNPIKPRKFHIPSPKPHQQKAPTPKTQNKTPTPKPQTTINEQNLEKFIKNNPGKKI